MPCVSQVNASADSLAATGVCTGSVETNTESGGVIGAISAPPAWAIRSNAARTVDGNTIPIEEEGD